jgi:hypothetical protein
MYVCVCVCVCVCVYVYVCVCVSECDYCVSMCRCVWVQARITIVFSRQIFSFWREPVNQPHSTRALSHTHADSHARADVFAEFRQTKTVQAHWKTGWQAFQSAERSPVRLCIRSASRIGIAIIIFVSHRHLFSFCCCFLFFLFLSICY